MPTKSYTALISCPKSSGVCYFKSLNYLAIIIPLKHLNKVILYITLVDRSQCMYQVVDWLSNLLSKLLGVPIQTSHYDYRDDGCNRYGELYRQREVVRDVINFSLLL